MSKYDNFENRPYLGNRCPWSKNNLNFNPIGVEKVYMQLLALLIFQIQGFIPEYCNF